jgi:hypothetical protein
MLVGCYARCFCTDDLIIDLRDGDDESTPPTT